MRIPGGCCLPDLPAFSWSGSARPDLPGTNHRQQQSVAASSSHTSDYTMQDKIKSLSFPQTVAVCLLT